MHRYRIDELPMAECRHGGTSCINNAGRIAGHVDTPDKKTISISWAACWEKGSLHRCNIAHSQVNAINNRGLMLCGASPDAWSGDEGPPKTPSSFLWDGTRITPLDKDAYAAINDDEIMVGSTEPKNTRQVQPDVVVNGRACYWKMGKRFLLPVPGNLWGSAATGINNRGTIIGGITKHDWLKTGRFTISVFWRKGEMHELPGRWDGYRWQSLTGLNASDVAVGEVEQPETGSKPIRWQGDRVDFLTLPHATTGSAYTLNNRGLIIGSFTPHGERDRFCLWNDGKFYELHPLLVNGSEWQVTLLTGINDRGQISAVGKRRSGTKSSHSVGLLLDPV